MGVDGIKIEIEGLEDLMRKVVNLRDLKKERSLLYRIYGQAATVLVRPYKNAMIELNDKTGPRTPYRNYASNWTDGNRIPAGALVNSIGKIRSKGHTPAVYVGPRTGMMRAGKKRIDGYYAQWLVFGRKGMKPKINLKSIIKPYEGPVKKKISKKLKEAIEKEWRR
jgi:hypothetical protein